MNNNLKYDRFHVQVETEAVAILDAECAEQSARSRTKISRGAVFGQLVMEHLAGKHKGVVAKTVRKPVKRAAAAHDRAAVAAD